MVNHRLTFETVCPNNHNQTIAFTRQEFEDRLKSDALVFHCNTCDTDWTPSGKDVAQLRKAFDRDSK